MIFLPSFLKLNNNHFHFHLLGPPVPLSPPPVLSCNPLGHFGFTFFFQLGWKYLTKEINIYFKIWEDQELENLNSVLFLIGYH